MVRRFPGTYAHVALVGDKSLLWNDGGTALLMYGVAGRSWVAMGDPVGGVEQATELAWRFQELALLHGGRRQRPST